MKMYAACLASYNNGRHHGEWFDLTDYDTAEELQEAIAERVLRTSPFPNVLVACPECDGPAEEPHAEDIGAWKCPCCHGKGSVPSAEEWAAHDYDGEGLNQFGEYPNLEKLLGHVQLVEEHGDAWLAYVEHVGEHYATEEAFRDAHLGECEDAEDYYTERLESDGTLDRIPDDLRHYFDFKSYARDMEINGSEAFVEYNGTTYVFDNNR